MKNIEVIDIRNKDREQILSIFKKYWDDDFGVHLEKKLDKYLSNDEELLKQNFKFFVARQDGEILGVVAVRDTPEHMSQYAQTNNSAELYVLAVKEKSKGVGTLMVNSVIEKVKARGYKEILLFSGETHKDSWGFHDSYAKRISEMKAPNGERGYVWSHLII